MIINSQCLVHVRDPKVGPVQIKDDLSAHSSRGDTRSLRGGGWTIFQFSQMGTSHSETRGILGQWSCSAAPPGGKRFHDKIEKITTFLLVYEAE